MPATSPVIDHCFARRRISRGYTFSLGPWYLLVVLLAFLSVAEANPSALERRSRGRGRAIAYDADRNEYPIFVTQTTSAATLFALTKKNFGTILKSTILENIPDKPASGTGKCKVLIKCLDEKFFQCWVKENKSSRSIIRCKTVDQNAVSTCDKETLVQWTTPEEEVSGRATAYDVKREPYTIYVKKAKGTTYFLAITDQTPQGNLESTALEEMQMPDNPVEGKCELLIKTGGKYFLCHVDKKTGKDSKPLLGCQEVDENRESTCDEKLLKEWTTSKQSYGQATAYSSDNHPYPVSIKKSSSAVTIGNLNLEDQLAFLEAEKVPQTTRPNTKSASPPTCILRIEFAHHQFLVCHLKVTGGPRTISRCQRSDSRSTCTSEDLKKWFPQTNSSPVRGQVMVYSAEHKPFKMIAVRNSSKDIKLVFSERANAGEDGFDPTVLVTRFEKPKFLLPDQCELQVNGIEHGSVVCRAKSTTDRQIALTYCKEAGLNPVSTCSTEVLEQWMKTTVGKGRMKAYSKDGTEFKGMITTETYMSGWIDPLRKGDVRDKDIDAKVLVQDHQPKTALSPDECLLEIECANFQRILCRAKSSTGGGATIMWCHKAKEDSKATCDTKTVRNWVEAKHIRILGENSCTAWDSEAHLSNNQWILSWPLTRIDSSDGMPANEMPMDDVPACKDFYSPNAPDSRVAKCAVELQCLDEDGDPSQLYCPYHWPDSLDPSIAGCDKGGLGIDLCNDAQMNTFPGYLGIADISHEEDLTDL